MVRPVSPSFAKNAEGVSIRYNTVAQTSGFIQFTSVRESVQLFSLEGQFRTPDIGVIADFNCVLMRNFCPSRLTS